MSISFIVTSYNIENYIFQCLKSVAACALAQDEIIVIDDGSSDATTDKIRAFIDGENLPSGVEIHPIYLGINTPGGVGIAANIGLDMAHRDTVFFVDGDDWLNPETFNHCRDVFAARGGDFMMVNYCEHDSETGIDHAPADQGLWDRVQASLSPQQRLELALSFIAVPWRKFYRRQFLQDKALRFPEGDFFYEDNPFHWAVCRGTEKFSFYNQVICFHRVNRSGATMAATGEPLLAFFSHFDTIRADIAADDTALHSAALRWLITNMRWHLERMDPNIHRAWGRRAIVALQGIDQQQWQQDIETHFAPSPIMEACAQLRAGDLQAFLTSQQISALKQEITSLHHDSRKTAQMLQEMKNTQEYAALLGLYRKD